MFISFIKITRPFLSFNVLLLYILGIGMAYYAGNFIYWDVVIIGLFWLVCIQMSAAFLLRYFDLRYDQVSLETTEEGRNWLPGSSILFIAYAFLAVVASLTVLLVRLIVDPAVYIIMAMIVLGAIGYSIPPLRLENSGYGELILSLLVANLIPALGFTLMGGETLRTLAMVTFPLTALHLAMLLVFSLHTYAADIKYSRRTILIRMGWQNGMLVHNLLILVAYLLLALAVTFRLPWQIGAPALLTLPVGLYQIWSINKIAGGAKPQWRSLILVSAALFCVTAYLLAFSFWIQ